MLLNELVLASVFYGISLLFIFVGLPFTVRIFSNTTLAYIAARLTGLLLFGYLVWCSASLHILNYQTVGIIWMLLLVSCLAGIASTYYTQTKSKQAEVLSLGKVLLVEVIGFSIYLIYLYLRSHNAEINGTERFMDMSLLAASGKTNYFPFVDPWYAGKPVNYYYFGAYLMSLVSNLAHLPYALTYNFALGLIYVQATLLTGGLIYAVSKSKLLALLGAVFLTSGGTVFFANCVLQSWFKAIPICGYASSTRLFSPSYIINEIPSYSFTVGDLHAHLLALPVFLLGLSFLYALWVSEKPTSVLVFVITILFASVGLINPWDLITLACLLVMLLFFKLMPFIKSHNWILTKSWVGVWILIMLCTFALMWPGTHNFQNPVMGLGFAPSFVREHQLSNSQWPTPISALLGIWGVFLGFMAYFFVKRLAWRKMEGKFLLLLGLMSLGIIIGVELFFVRDIYSVANPMYFRANTTFKFGYHAWSMLVIATFAGLGILFAEYKKQVQWFVLGMAGLLMLVGAVYPVVAVRQFYLDRGNELTLDGAAWMRVASSGDLATINYINKNLPKRTVIAEAVGDSYTTFSRISTYTGNIAPMGWQTHEWTWRFHLASPGLVNSESGWTAVSLVAGDIKTLYETSNIDVAKQIIAKYGIQYVYVGMLERSKYVGINEIKFSKIGRVVFSYGSSSLYEIDAK